MKVYSYGTPKKEPKIVYEGSFKGVKYTIKEVEVDDDNETEEDTDKKD